MLSTAVLRRDKLAVEKVLRQHPQYLKAEQNVFGQRPIHLAIGWPDGLKLLLSVADESLLHRDLELPVLNRSTPLDYAIAFGCPLSIRLLADAGVAFDFNWSRFVGTGCLNKDVSEVVLSIIVERLRELLNFGKERLAAEKYSSLQIAGFESFDSKVRPLLNCLHSEGIRLPRKFASTHHLPGWGRDNSKDFWFYVGGIFHQDELCRSTADAFFRAGFTDIDSEAEKITPLMNLNLPDYRSEHEFYFSRCYQVVEFLVEKGGRLDRQIPSEYVTKPSLRNDSNNSYRVLHRIASFAWHAAISLDSIEVLAIAHLGSSQIWQDILQSKTSDPCVCACTSGGCRPISLALKSFVRHNRPWHSQTKPLFDTLPNWGETWDQQNWRVAVEVLSKLTILLDGMKGEQLAEDVIRFLTFSALGLTHTCCRHSTRVPPLAPLQYMDCKIMIKVMDLADIEEIRDEEAELIESLDFLVDIFMKDFRALGIPLSQFLLENWQKAMLAELSGKDEMSKTWKEQIEELGVKVHADSNSLGENDGDEH
jgi:hypothetical protein